MQSFLGKLNLREIVNIAKRAHHNVKIRTKIIVPFVVLYALTALIAGPVAIKWFYERTEEKAISTLESKVEISRAVLESIETTLKTMIQTMCWKWRISLSSLRPEIKIR